MKETYFLNPSLRIPLRVLWTSEKIPDRTDARRLDGMVIDGMIFVVVAAVDNTKLSQKCV